MNLLSTADAPKRSLAEAQPSELFLNRELSLLEFNRRVLELSKDENIPLLERLRFLCISSSNLDEFFEIRVAGLKQMLSVGSTQAGPDGILPQDLMAAISQRAHALVDEQYRVFNEVLVPALEREKIRFVRRTDWSKEQDTWLRNYFENELLPVLSPIGLDPVHPFPRILNKSLNFIVSLSGKDAFGRNTGFAIVQAPRALPRLIQIPATLSGSGAHDFVFLSSVIHAYVDDLFPGMQATGCFQFRLTRNSDLLVDEEETEDLLVALEGELSQRQWGDTVRLEVAHECPERMSQYLMDVAALTPQDLYQVNGPVNLNRLLAIPDLVDRPDLKYPPFTPRLVKALQPGNDFFAAIRERDILLHHPFDSFAPVIEFLRQAARDPNVLAIKQTLYRTGTKSGVVDALMEAARNGKEVTVVVELRARFDEADNIDLAEKLQEVGAHVVYGVVGHKAHAKMILVVRREDPSSATGALKHYAHLSTGNYHPRTARLYTDYGLFTADPGLCKDVHAVFLQLTSLGKVSKMKHLLQSPFTLAKELHKKIERETELAQKGRPGRLIAKLNALVEPDIIRALYKASQAGVSIDLVVRGMCSLRPGLPGISDTIRVRSIIGRFLEHTRVFYFGNDGEPEVWLASADWMERNFQRRVEVAFPILDKKHKERIIAELNGYLEDTAQSWVLQADGSCLNPETPTPKGIQQKLLDEATG
ncbi:MAG: polyphosphate kinase 1 [Nevskiales bacterium]|nr:polyphosphate kinase 1 [Nevskiales bacterium]